MLALIRSTLSLVPLCLGLLALTPRAEAGTGFTPPTITSPTKASITATTATLGGNIVNSGGVAITTRGIVYALTSENPNPSVGSVGVTLVSENTTNTGVFTLPITNLKPGSNYSFAAYATNSSGDAYSAVDTFSTPLPTTTQTFNYTGAVQTFTVPAGVTSITIEAFGAQGGTAAQGPMEGTPGAGGLGSQAKGTLAVTPGQVFNLYVGGMGGQGTGGFNGGGKGAAGLARVGFDNAPDAGGAGGGGGASDVRFGGTAVADRILVAGGGGGGGKAGANSTGVSSAGVNGGNGGGQNGGNGITSASGGGGFGGQGATGGNPGIGCSGFLGGAGATTTTEVGGTGGLPQSCCSAAATGGGGGGGGYVGGGGGGGGSAGTTGCSGNEKGGGGGGAAGSSYVSGSFTDTSTAFSQNLSDGYITITYLNSAILGVSGKSIAIASGDATPNTSDDTDYGNVIANVGSVTHTFTISNTGTLALNLTGTTPVTLSGSSDFSVTVQPSSPVTAPSGTTTFDVKFTPTSLGPKTATVSIASDDAAHPAYTFDIKGTGTSITHILPPNGTVDGGTAVTIVGKGFTGATAVSIGGVAATDVTVINDSMINCTTGAHAAGTVDVVVGTDTGTSLYTYGALPIPAGAVWKQRTTSGLRSWSSIASSADGSKLAAVDDDGGGGYIYTSTDSGATWTVQTASGQYYWRSIASSADGSKLAAVDFGRANGGYIYTSTDSGATWTQQTASGQRNWQSIASSADGSKLAAVSVESGGRNGGYIYTSTDSGATWTEQKDAGQHFWYSIASSADGSKLAAGENFRGSGYIYTSTDGGATWTQQIAAGQRNWRSIASSADGSKLAAGDVFGHINTSTDSGANWTEQTAPQSGGSIASSADGSKLAAVDADGYIETSTDGGVTWTKQKASGQRGWSAIASSADGSKLAAAVYDGGYIYTSVGGDIPPALPKLQISDDGGTTYVDPQKQETFGNVRVNTSGTPKTFSLTNSGNADLNVEQLTIDGRNPSDFQVSRLVLPKVGSVGGAHVLGTTVSTVVKPADVYTFSVSFSPSAVGPRTATLHIRSDDPDVADFTLRLTGTGTAPAILVRDDDAEAYVKTDATEDLGSVVLGKTSSPRHMRISNGLGTESLTVGTMTIDGTNSSDFAITPLVLDQRAGTGSSGAVVQNNQGFLIKAGQEATFTITFTPSAVGTRTALLHIPSDDPKTKEFVINLTGNGQQLDPPTVSLPKTQPVLNKGTGRYEWLLTVRNQNANAITGFDLYISDLPSGVSVWNAATDLKPASLPGTSYARLPSKTPVYRIHCGSLLSAGASTTVVVEFYKRTRPLPTLKPRIELVVVESDIPSKGLYGVPVLKVTKVKGKGNLVEFASTIGGNYRLWYTANVRNTNVIPVPTGPWYSVPALIKGTGTKTLWMDQGPPATIISPLDDPKREYRVELVLPYTTTSR